MTLTVVDPGRPIGVGSLIRLNSSGPYPIDDWFEVDVYPPPYTTGIVSGMIVPGSAPHIDVYLGWDGKRRSFYSGHEGTTDGTSLHLVLWHFHANGVVVEQTNDTSAWTWWNHSPQTNLLGFVQQSADVQSILNAVIRTFPAP